LKDLNLQKNKNPVKQVVNVIFYIILLYKIIILYFVTIMD